VSEGVSEGVVRVRVRVIYVSVLDPPPLGLARFSLNPSSMLLSPGQVTRA
jgi:hypothetical protein